MGEHVLSQPFEKCLTSDPYLMLVETRVASGVWLCVPIMGGHPPRCTRRVLLLRLRVRRRLLLRLRVRRRLLLLVRVRRRLLLRLRVRRRDFPAFPFFLDILIGVVFLGGVCCFDLETFSIDGDGGGGLF